jgi:hypothetical protein
MDVSGQLHLPAGLPAAKRPARYSWNSGAGWAADSVWAQGRREEFLASDGDMEIAKKMIKCSHVI